MGTSNKGSPNLTDNTISRIRKAVAGYFSFLGLASAVLLAYFAISSAPLVNRGELLSAYGSVLIFLMMVFGSLAYGLLRHRRWVVRLHGAILAIWLTYTLPATVLIVPRLMRQSLGAGLTYLLLVYVLPIGTQAFLLGCRTKALSSGPPLNLLQKTGVAVAVFFSVVVTFYVTIAVLWFSLLVANEAEGWTWLPHTGKPVSLRLRADNSTADDSEVPENAHRLSFSSPSGSGTRFLF